MTAITTAEDTAAVRAITRSKVTLLLNEPWFGNLAMRLKLLPGTELPPGEVDTMATDGTRLYYHAGFVLSLTDSELVGVMAHEIMHCSFLHPYRRENRDAFLWNVACDYAINDILLQSGFTLPKGVLHDKKYAGMSAEKIYAILQSEGKGKQPQPNGNPGKPGKPGKGDGKGDGGFGKVLDAPKPGEGQGKGKGDGKGDGSPGKGTQPGNQPGNGRGQDEDRTPSDWVIDTIQAEKLATAAGKMPGGLQSELRKSRLPKTNYREVLRRFVDNTVACDYSYSTPNRRMLGMGHVLPGLRKENVGELVIGVDTSGSFEQSMLDQTNADIADILQSVRPSKITVIYCDTRVGTVDTFEPDGEEFKFAEKVGRGGTKFAPVFNWVEKNMAEPPKAMLYFTDLEPSDHPDDPGYPVLWLVPETCMRKDWPWGEVVEVTMDGRR